MGRRPLGACPDCWAATRRPTAQAILVHLDEEVDDVTMHSTCVARILGDLEDRVAGLEARHDEEDEAAVERRERGEPR